MKTYVKTAAKAATKKGSIPLKKGSACNDVKPFITKHYAKANAGFWIAVNTY